MKNGRAIFGVWTRSSSTPAATLPSSPASAESDSASAPTPVAKPRSLSSATVWARTPPTTSEWITSAPRIIQ